MTTQNQLKIQQLREQGYGSKKIAKELGISVNTIKTF